MKILLHPVRPGDPLLKLGIATTDAQSAARSEGFCPDCLIALAGDPPIRCPDCRAFWPSSPAL